MNCKFCNAELEENATVCPYCGKAVETAAEEALTEEITPMEEAASVEETVPVEEAAPVEETPAEAPAKKVKKEKKPMGKGAKAIIAVSLALVVLLGIATGVVAALGINFTNWENNLYFKDRYTAPDFLAKLSADTVVATVGDHELTNGMLQLYFGRQLWDLVEEYGDYLTYLGLDLNEPLYTQEFPDADGATWEQYLLSMAIGAWVQQQTLVCMAQEESFEYPAGLQTFLDSLEATLDEQAVANGYKDGEALVQKEMGASTNMALYKAYSAVYNQSMEYYADLYEAMEPDIQQVEAYFDEHADEMYEQYGVVKEENPVIDVRHILLIPEETVDAETGATVTTDDSKAACLREAEALLEQWKSGEATQESFAQLANEYSQDPGSNTVGGLYEFVYQGDMVDTFNDWCFDESRQPGDTGIVETDYGYHIMYFVYGADEWYRASYESMRGEMCQERIEAAYEKYPSKVYFYNIMLSQIEFE